MGLRFLTSRLMTSSVVGLMGLKGLPASRLVRAQLSGWTVPSGQ
jgi:hypothetical protein